MYTTTVSCHSTAVTVHCQRTISFYYQLATKQEMHTTEQNKSEPINVCTVCCSPKNRLRIILEIAWLQILCGVFSLINCRQLRLEQRCNQNEIANTQRLVSKLNKYALITHFPQVTPHCNNTCIKKFSSFPHFCSFRMSK